MTIRHEAVKPLIEPARSELLGIEFHAQRSGRQMTYMGSHDGFDIRLSRAGKRVYFGSKKTDETPTLTNRLHRTLYAGFNIAEGSYDPEYFPFQQGDTEVLRVDNSNLVMAHGHPEKIESWFEENLAFALARVASSETIMLCRIGVQDNGKLTQLATSLDATIVDAATHPPLISAE